MGMSVGDCLDCGLRKEGQPSPLQTAPFPSQVLRNSIRKLAELNPDSEPANSILHDSCCFDYKVSSLVRGNHCVEPQKGLPSSFQLDFTMSDITWNCKLNALLSPSPNRILLWSECFITATEMDLGAQKYTRTQQIQDLPERVWGLSVSK